MKQLDHDTDVIETAARMWPRIARVGRASRTWGFFSWMSEEGQRVVVLFYIRPGDGVKYWRQQTIAQGPEYVTWRLLRELKNLAASYKRLGAREGQTWNGVS